MKILCVGDLHGRKPKIHFKDFDVIVCIGDVCSDKEFRPLKNQWIKYLEKDDSLPLDMYTFIALKIGVRKLQQMEKNALKEGRKIMEYLDSLGKPVFFIPGNWDQSYGETRIKDTDASDYHYFKSFLDFYLGSRVNPLLTKGLKNVRVCQYRLQKFKGYNFLGYGLSSIYEDPILRGKRKSRTYSKEEMEKLKRAYKKIIDKLDNAYKKRDKNLPTIFLTHNVPHNTKLDVLMDKDSDHHKKHFGSTVARQFCDRHQPLFCIGGHMHEHFGKDKIGKTTAINVGFGSDVNVMITLDDGKIKKIEFWDSAKKYKKKN